MPPGDALAHANRRIRDLAARLGEDLDWEFVCECGEPDCSVAVPLTADVYDELRDLNLALLAPGHPRKRARTAREQASALRLEALALRNQARHQQKRAARVAAGLAPLTELVEATCRTCGYIVRAERLPAVCPVCQSMDWQSSETDESPVRDSSNPA